MTDRRGISPPVFLFRTVIAETGAFLLGAATLHTVGLRKTEFSSVFSTD